MGVPERIGRYQVLGELGQGAMGTVYRGRDEGLDRDVAVKVMSKGMADADARARFLREARAAARLQHPNIVVIYELGEHEGAPFMALELLEGVDLQRGIDAGVRPDPRATLPVVLQLLAGLGHAHEHGIVHRDVKPSNVFLPFGRPAKIMDFGVARLAGLGTTTAGVVVGTPNYMSPEQASAGEVDGRSDLFSAGLILYELVTGEKAYQADTLVAILYKILHEPPDLSLIPEGRQWERLRAVLSRALARKADDRYPDARAMSAELARRSRTSAEPWTGRRPRTRRSSCGRGPRPGRRPRPRRGTRRSRARARAPPAPRAHARSARPGLPAWPRVERRVAVALARGWRLGGARRRGRMALAAAGRAATRHPDAAAPPVADGGRARRHAGGCGRDADGHARRRRPPRPRTPDGAAADAGGCLLPGLGAEARLLRADDLVARGRWAEALAEARAVLEVEPRSARATALAQQAEAELVIEECLRNARLALKAGDRERALEEVRRGFLVRKNDARLMAMHREVVAQ